MSTLGEISNAFFSANDIFEPVVGAPTDADIKRIRRAIVKILQSFYYHSNHDILSGIINPEAKYTSRFSHAFDCLKDINANNYDPKMPSNPNNQDMRKREVIFKPQKARSILVAIADAEARRFILGVVEET